MFGFNIEKPRNSKIDSEEKLDVYKNALEAKDSNPEIVSEDKPFVDLNVLEDMFNDGD